MAALLLCSITNSLERVMLAFLGSWVSPFDIPCDVKHFLMHVIIVPLRQSFYMPGSTGIFPKLGLGYDCGLVFFIYLEAICISV